MGRRCWRRDVSSGWWALFTDLFPDWLGNGNGGDGMERMEKNGAVWIEKSEMIVMDAKG